MSEPSEQEAAFLEPGVAPRVRVGLGLAYLLVLGFVVALAVLPLARLGLPDGVGRVAGTATVIDLLVATVRSGGGGE